MGNKSIYLFFRVYKWNEEEEVLKFGGTACYFVVVAVTPCALCVLAHIGERLYFFVFCFIQWKMYENIGWDLCEGEKVGNVFL